MRMELRTVALAAAAAAVAVAVLVLLVRVRSPQDVAIPDQALREAEALHRGGAGPAPTATGNDLTRAPSGAVTEPPARDLPEQAPEQLPSPDEVVGAGRGRPVGAGGDPAAQQRELVRREYDRGDYE